MTAIKSNTDLEQSKILAEILSIESADMYYQYVLPKSDKIKYNPVLGNPIDALEWYNKGYTHFGKSSLTLNEYCIPCWSLAALINILPPYLFEFERGIDLNIYPNLNGKGWHCSYMPNSIENMKIDKFKLITSEDTLIDACVEMIIKLHEQKLI